MAEKTIDLEQFSSGNKLRIEVGGETGNGNDEYTGKVIDHFDDAVIVQLDDEMTLERNRTVDTIEITYAHQINSTLPLVKSGMTVYRTPVRKADLIA